ncbi:MAG: hypothetical protein DSY82_07460 [Flavobacteriia bacterium]|nr:MAG: hypothetical protein DSY82_07460 [Flavobacteriia bacterium]
MKIKTLTLTAICISILIGCSNEKIIKLSLNHQNGYGYFNPGFVGISPYSEDKNNPWRKTYLTVTGTPEDWTDIKYGDIETNIYQSAYQNYFAGNITQDLYEELQKSWGWEPDTLKLSKELLKTKIAFAFGKDSAGITNFIVDANNNLDFSDDKSFIPYAFSPREEINDSVALSNAINVTFERLVNNKKQLITAPLFIAHISHNNMFMCNFPQYSVADFGGKKIAVCSDGFTNLSYKKPKIVILSDSLKNGDKISNEKLTAKNEFIEIKGELYKNIGVNINNNKLELERINLPKSELYSTQIGFKSIPFEGIDFITETQIAFKKLRGKYVLLDFWAVWCGPCLQEIPNMKDLYKKTNREKFEIIGIVGDSSSDALKKIIEKDSINWPQILSTDSNKIKETYGIHGYPTTFLVNPEGIIVAKNLRGKELEDKVLKLINK